MKLLETPIAEYITHWEAHLSTFWVPLIVGLIFLGLPIKELSQRNIRLFILHLFLMLCCAGYIVCGAEILSKLTALVQ